MNRIPAIAIFDIGKTNKKLFLFDSKYNILLEKSIQFEEIKDEDGDPCEDLQALTEWVKTSISELMNLEAFNVLAINFSTYGASFVHLDKEGKSIAPLYNAYAYLTNGKIVELYLFLFGRKSDVRWVLPGLAR